MRTARSSVYHEDAPGSGTAAEGGRDSEGFGHTEQGQGWQGDREADPGDREAEDAGHECGFCGVGGEDHSRHGAVDGHRSRRVSGSLEEQRAQKDCGGFPSRSGCALFVLGGICGGFGFDCRC